MFGLPSNTNLIWTAPLVAILVWIIWVDWRKQIIPDFANLALLVCGFAQHTFPQGASLNEPLLGSLVGGLCMYVMRDVYFRVRRGHGLGMGDVKFMAAAGAWVGALSLPWVLLIASLVALSYVVIASAMQKGFDATARLAFGPFLALGLFVTWLIENV